MTGHPGRGPGERGQQAARPPAAPAPGPARPPAAAPAPGPPPPAAPGPPPAEPDAAAAVAEAHRREWAFVLAATARVARDLDVAEECVQDAYVAALDAWSQRGVPDNPAAWLTTTARRKALDALRRDKTLRAKLPLLIEPEPGPPAAAGADDVIGDDRLRLVFTCCHPALAREAQVALTLRLVCGLTTAEIAGAFLVSEATMAARVTRAKKKIAAARIAYRVPARARAARPAGCGAHRGAPALHHRPYRAGRRRPDPR